MKKRCDVFCSVVRVQEEKQRQRDSAEPKNMMRQPVRATVAMDLSADIDAVTAVIPLMDASLAELRARNLALLDAFGSMRPECAEQAKFYMEKLEQQVQTRAGAATLLNKLSNRQAELIASKEAGAGSLNKAVIKQQVRKEEVKAKKLQKQQAERGKTDVQLTMSQLVETTLLMSLTSQRPSPCNGDSCCLCRVHRSQAVDAFRGPYGTGKDAAGAASVGQRANCIFS